MLQLPIAYWSVLTAERPDDTILEMIVGLWTGMILAQKKTTQKSNALSQLKILAPTNLCSLSLRMLGCKVIHAGTIIL